MPLIVVIATSVVLANFKEDTPPYVEQEETAPVLFREHEITVPSDVKLLLAIYKYCCLYWFNVTFPLSF